MRRVALAFGYEQLDRYAAAYRKKPFAFDLRVG
jgi:hypothetical protein